MKKLKLFPLLLGMVVGVALAAPTDYEGLFDTSASNAPVTIHAGSDVAADLEEETHATEHSDGGTDEITAENLATACTDGQPIGGDGLGGIECETVGGDVSGSIESLSLGADVVADNEIDYVNVTLNDLTFDVGSTTKTEFGYLAGVTSAIQTQIDSKVGAASPTFTGTITVTNAGAGTDPTLSSNSASQELDLTGLLTASAGVNVAVSQSYSVAGTAILSDAAGTLTLSNVDALDATTESTVEAAIDTLLNLTSIQGLSFTFADAGADAVFGWDDTATAYENLTAAEVLAIVGGAANDFDASGDVTVVAADISDASANGQSLITAANYAAMRALLDLEAGTDFYSIAAADAAFEGELNDSAGLAAALSDETGTGANVHGTSPTIATPTLTLQDANGAAPTTDGQIKYDRTTERLEVGDGVSTSEFVKVGTLTDTQYCTWDAANNEMDCNSSPAGSGDVTAVGDCATGDCFASGGSGGTTLYSDTGLIMDLDDNNDGSETFTIRDGADATVLTVAESGLVTVTGNVVTGNGYLMGLGSGKGSFLFTDAVTDDIRVQNANFGISIGSTPDTVLHVGGAITSEELSSDPSDPDEGANAEWQSDGTGTGDDGDIYRKVTAASTTKTSKTYDYSNDSWGNGRENLALGSCTADGNTTGAINEYYLCDISGFTADRDLTLPTGTAGDRLKVCTSTGDDTYELVLKGAATVTINGGSAATEWSRLFITGECVEFVATSGTNWFVYEDDRIPSRGEMTRDASQSLNHNNTTQILFDNEVEDVGDITDITTNDRFNIRRTGRYETFSYIEFNVLDDGERCAVHLNDSGTVVMQNSVYSPTTNAGMNCNLTVSRSYTAGDYAQMSVYHNEGASFSTLTTERTKPRMVIQEILP